MTSFLEARDRWIDAYCEEKWEREGFVPYLQGHVLRKNGRVKHLSPSRPPKGMTMADAEILALQTGYNVVPISGIPLRRVQELQEMMAYEAL